MTSHRSSQSGKAGLLRARLRRLAVACLCVSPTISAAQESPLLRESLNDRPSPFILRSRTFEPAQSAAVATPSDDEATPAPRSAARAPAAANDEEPVRRRPARQDTASTAAVRQSTVDAADMAVLDRGARREPAIEVMPRPTDDEPFAAQGIRMGTFAIRPTLEQGLTATDNADSTAAGKRAVVSETTARIAATREWDGNSASIDAFGSYRRQLSGQEVKDHALGVDGAVELQLGGDYKLKGTAGYLRKPDSASAPDAIPGVPSQPIRQTFTGSLGIEKDAGKARLAATGAITHELFGDVMIGDCCVLSQKDRNNTLYALTLRGGYEISPALTPFIEAEIGRRQYRQRYDNAGYERSSLRLGARAGVAFDLGEKLSGEIAAGWIAENFDDGRLKTISAPSIAAAIAWSPMRGTIVTLSGSTTVEGTSAAGESGSVLYSGGVAVERQMRANLTGNAAAGISWRDYAGSDEHDLIASAELGATWWLNRYAGLLTRLRHETLESSIPGRDARTNSIFVGLRLQR
ncbi:MAG: outer membrane beta-barrel protein [Rhizobiaceae bacterium]